MTTVKWFSSEMAGAPVLTGTKGAFVALLEACMVTGFGLKTVTSVTVAGGIATVVLASGQFIQHQIIEIMGATPAGLNGQKRVLALNDANSFTFDATGITDQVATGTITSKVPGMGWLKPYSGLNKAVFKVDPAVHPDTTGCLVRCDDNGNYTMEVRGYESMTDVDTGLGLTPTTTQMARSALFRSDAISPSAVMRNWFIVGDDRFVYIGVGHQTTSPFGWSCFGEFKSTKTADPFNFLIGIQYSNDSTVASTSSNTLASPNYSYLYCARNSIGLGGSVQMRHHGWLFDVASSKFSGGTGATLPYPNTADYGIYFTPVYIIEASPNVHRGVFPGLLFIPHATGGKITSTYYAPYFDTEVPGFPNSVIMIVGAAEASSTNAAIAFNLTGPWEH